MALSEEMVTRLENLSRLYSEGGTPGETGQALPMPSVPGVAVPGREDFKPTTKTPGYITDKESEFNYKNDWNDIWEPRYKFWFDNAINNPRFSRYGQNLARGTAETNVNNRSHANTLRNQRLVDKLNAKVYRTPYIAGYNLTSPFGPSATRASQGGQIYQMPKVETEETRQMNRMRDYESKERGLQMDLRNKYESYEYLMQEAESLQKLELSGKYSEADLQKKKDELAEKFHAWRLENEYSYNRAFTEFERRLVQQIGREDANVVLGLYGKYGSAIATMAGMLLSKLGTALPSAQQAIQSQGDAEIFRKALNSGNPRAAAAEFARKYAIDDATAIRVTYDVFDEVFPGFVEDAANTAVQAGKAGVKGAVKGAKE
jgi:hypothetical protein